MIKKFFKSLFSAAALIAILFLSSVVIYAFYISAQNKPSSIDKYYFTRKVFPENIEIKELIFEGIPLTEISADLEGNHYSAFVRKKEAPEYIAVLFAGSRTGQKAIKYLNGIFEDSMIIAMGYPFKSRNYTMIEIIETILRARRGLFNVSLVTEKFISIATEDIKGPRPEIISVGVSFGAPFAYQLAAVDKNVDRIVQCYGFSNLGGMLDNNLKYHFNKKDFDMPLIRRAAGWMFEKLLYPLEPEYWVRYNRSTPILFIRGRNDNSIPPEYILPFIVKHQNKKEVVLEGDHFDKKDFKRIINISEIVSRWLKGKPGHPY